MDTMGRNVRRRLCCLLCMAVLFSALPHATAPAAAAERVLLLEQAQSMAVSNSSDITQTNNEIILKQMKYVEAVDGIKAKVKNKTSFRWSPLLSFKFPEQLNLIEEFELNVKPLTLQAELDSLEHKRDDLRFAARADVSKSYIEVYVLQEKIAFYEERLATAEAQLTRNQARLATGEATQTDVDSMQKSVDELTSQISELKRSFQTGKEELSDLIGMDVTSGYTFRNPLKELSLPREQLDAIIQYTVDNDQTMYEANMTASTALMNLESYESLMRKQYGSKLNYIQLYVDMAKSGQEIDYAAFKLKYGEMLTALDQPWNAKIRILFFTFTKEWFKGEIDGTRYIEDEMYAIYTACMEYSNAKKDRDTTEEDLRKQVSEQYEQLVTAWNSYSNLLSQVETAKEALDKVTALNQLGQADYDELSTAQEDYESIQIDALDALSTYNTLLQDFDRLTCGAVTAYMNGTDLSAEAGAGGDSYARIDPITDPYYYIYTTVEDLTFHVGVSIPEDFSPAVTDFEVWSEGIQIGERTVITEELTHLTIDYGGTSTLVLRFYDGETYVTECEIDATVPRDVLDLGQDEVAEEGEEQLVGTYSVSTSAVGTLSTSTLTLELNTGVDAESFTITYGTGNVYTSEPTPVDEEFQYLTLLVASLDDVELNLYDRDGTLTMTGRFDTQTQSVYATPVQ